MKALIIVDVQNDFISGSLAVNETEGIIKKINNIRDKYDFVYFSRDWHPKNHISFYTNHKDKKLFT